MSQNISVAVEDIVLVRLSMKVDLDRAGTNGRPQLKIDVCWVNVAHSILSPFVAVQVTLLTTKGKLYRRRRAESQK
jgi:hypothetical protein